MSTTNTTTASNPPPTTFLITLFPCFQLMDLAGPLDILNMLSSVFPTSGGSKISMKFIAETLDPVPTKPIVPKRAGWEFEGLDEETVNRGFVQWLQPDLTFDDVLKGLEGGNGGEGKTVADVIFVPGGVGSRLKRKFKDDGRSESLVKPLVEFLGKVKGNLGLGFMTVCTGSDVLASTGVLDGRRATTNMMRFDYVSGRHGGVKWEKGARWVRSRRDEAKTLSRDGDGEVESGKKSSRIPEIWSSAGISAGMDVTLAFVAEYFGGMDVSRKIAKAEEYDWSEPGDGEICKFYGRYFDV